MGGIVYEGWFLKKPEKVGKSQRRFFVYDLDANTITYFTNEKKSTKKVVSGDSPCSASALHRAGDSPLAAPWEDVLPHISGTISIGQLRSGVCRALAHRVTCPVTPACLACRLLAIEQGLIDVSDTNTNAVALGSNLEIVTPNRTYYLTAESATVARQWADAVTGGTSVQDASFLPDSVASYDTYQGSEAGGRVEGPVLLSGWWRKKRDEVDKKDRRLFLAVCVPAIAMCGSR